MHDRNSGREAFPWTFRKGSRTCTSVTLLLARGKPSVGLGFLHDSCFTRAAAAWDKYTSGASLSSPSTRACRRIAVRELVLLIGRRPALQIPIGRENASADLLEALTPAPPYGTSAVLNCDVQPMTEAHKIGRSWGNGDAAPNGSVESDVVSDALMSWISLTARLPSSATIVVVCCSLRMFASSMVA